MKPIINKLVYGVLALGLSYGCGGDDDNNTPPNKPIPDKGVSFVCEDIKTTLSWTCSDPDGDELKYTLIYSDDPDMSSSVITETYKTEDEVVLNPGTKYYWQVIASDGKSTTEGDIWEFSTKSQPIESKVPNTPILLSPKNDLKAAEVTFQWNPVRGDDGSGNITYHLFINGTETIVRGATEHKQELTPGTCEWYIIASDADGNSAESVHITIQVK